MNTRILVLTYYWPPSGGAGVQRCLKFVKYLPEFGYHPVVITVDPKYAAYPVKDISMENDISPDLEIYKTKAKDNFKLYKKLTGNKKLPHGGFTGETNKSFKSKIIRFIRGNFFIPDPRKGWNKYAFKKAIEIIEKNNIKTVLTTSPPHSTQLIGLKLKKKYPEIKWIADLRDPWTDIYYYKKLMHTTIAKWIDKRYEKNVLQKANHILCVSNDLKKTFLHASGNNISDSIHIIPNGFDHEDFKQTLIPDNKKFTITYTGTLSTEYDISGLIKALCLIKQQYDFVLRFIGSDKNVIDKFINDELKDHIEIKPYLPHSEIVKYMQQSDLLLLVIPRSKNNKGILTGKLFEYLGSGNPILNIGPENGDAALIINECKAGETFNYENDKEIYDFIISLIKHPENSKIYSKVNVNKYSRKELTSALVKIISE